MREKWHSEGRIGWLIKKTGFKRFLKLLSYSYTTKTEADRKTRATFLATRLLASVGWLIEKAINE